jgi:hypothetical protein
MKKIIFLIFSSVLTFYSLSCSAWGAYGHRLVGDIAKVYVNKSVLDSVNKYLGDMTWADASVWMDEIKSNHFYDNLKPMHYINIEEDKSYVKTNEDNIINELEKVIHKLKDRSKLSKDDINQDLKILFHLMGDLHQPLHVAFGIDKGGNTIDVDFLGETTNLHRVWDSQIIEHDKYFKSELIEMSKHLTNSEIHNQQKVDVLPWMNESRAYLPQVYDFKKGMIDENYIYKVTPIMEKQILYAGLRLSGVLNSIFNLSSTETTSTTIQLSSSAISTPLQPQPQLKLEEKINDSHFFCSPDSAKYFEAKLTTVCGNITGTHVGKSGVMMLNFGKSFPDNSFTAVVFEGDVSKFKSANHYDGKTVCVTGKIQIYKGKPEIILNEASQLKEQ